MILPNYTEKSLVPYSIDAPSAKKPGKRYRLLSFFDKMLESVCRFYKIRSRSYILFLFLFFLISVFSLRVSSKHYGYGSEWVDNLLTDFYVNDGVVSFLFCNPVMCLLYRVIAFCAGFTLFSFPIAAVMSSRVFLTECFYFSVVSVDFSNIGFYSAFVFVLIFSLQILVDICFFSEAGRFYYIFKANPSVKVVLPYMILLFAYLAFSFLFLNLQLSFIY